MNLANHNDIKAAFFDFDGTIFNGPRQKIPSSCLYALQQLRANGIKVCLATGRHIVYLDNSMYKISNFDAIITMNGQAILDNKRNVLYSKNLGDGDCLILKHLYETKKYPIFLDYADKTTSNFIDDTVRKAIGNIDINPPRHSDKVLDEPILIGVIFCNKREIEILKNVFEHYQVTQWNEFGYDLIDKHAGKESAIPPILNYWGLSPENAIAFGDSDNDLGMMKLCKYSVAMGNAIEECKKNATYTTTKIDEDGIYNACLHFGLIKPK